MQKGGFFFIKQRERGKERTKLVEEKKENFRKDIIDKIINGSIIVALKEYYNQKGNEQMDYNGDIISRKYYVDALARKIKSSHFFNDGGTFIKTKVNQLKNLEETLWNEFKDLPANKKFYNNEKKKEENIEEYLKEKIAQDSFKSVRHYNSRGVYERVYETSELPKFLNVYDKYVLFFVLRKEGENSLEELKKYISGDLKVTFAGRIGHHDTDPGYNNIEIGSCKLDTEDECQNLHNRLKNEDDYYYLTRDNEKQEKLSKKWIRTRVYYQEFYQNKINGLDWNVDYHNRDEKDDKIINEMNLSVLSVDSECNDKYETYGIDTIFELLLPSNSQAGGKKHKTKRRMNMRKKQTKRKSKGKTRKVVKKNKKRKSIKKRKA
jgi:hypothetical protein